MNENLENVGQNLPEALPEQFQNVKAWDVHNQPGDAEKWQYGLTWGQQLGEKPEGCFVRQRYHWQRRENIVKD